MPTSQANLLDSDENDEHPSEYSEDHEHQNPPTSHLEEVKEENLKIESFKSSVSQQHPQAQQMLSPTEAQKEQ